ncbi:MAG: peptide deformylase [Clostridia bacterium]|nr:peptide deformylase [Deltaproteobacteria bacterium]
MALRKIAQIGHPVLRDVARAITPVELASPVVQGFIDDLVETMRDASGAGLAATQVYERLRIFAVEVRDNPRYPYKPTWPLTIVVNPEVTALSDIKFENFEGCLSIPNLRGRAVRHAEVRVRGLDREGKPLDFEVRGVSAGTFQHENDHLNGVMFLDRLANTKSLCTWDHFERYEKDCFVSEVRELVARWGS